MTDRAFLPSPSPVPAVIAVVIHEGRALIVRRANPPDAGLWGFPGGKIEYGETVEAATLRELFEETGVRAEAREVITTLDVLIAVGCRWLSGHPQAGDDALEARWFPVADLHPDRPPMSADVDMVARRAEELASRWTNS